MTKTVKNFKQKKRISITLTLCMLFQIIQGSSLLTEKAFAATGFRHVTSGNDVVLGGNYIEVGVSKAGSFGTASNAPAAFHPTDGGVGLRVDGDGFDIGNPPTTGDFFLPGTPEESFTVGYKPGAADAEPTKYTNDERVQAQSGQTPDINTVTTDTSSGDLLSATTAGTTQDSNLGIQQKITFKVDDKFFKNTVTYKNNGSTTLYDVRYMRSFDPDQDADLHSNFYTYNCVLENFPQDNRAIVRAEGGYTKEPVFFISTDSRARASSFGYGTTSSGGGSYGFQNRDPYDPNAYDVDGSKLKQPEQEVDKAIALTFALGNLAPGQSTTFQYYTSLDPNYEAGLAAIMGSLGAQIDNGAATASSTNVTLNLTGKNVTQMRFSNDGLSWSDWETYAATKAWTLTPGNGYKTVYVEFKDTSGDISDTTATIDFEAPDITPPTFSVSGNPTSWTNNDVTLTVAASDEESGLDHNGAYSFDGGKTWTTSTSKTFSSNQTVNISVKDSAGNISSQSVTIDKIDKAAPDYTGITQSPVPSVWTNGTVNLTVNGATDNAGSGLDAAAYSFSTTEGEYNWQASNVSSDFSTNQTVYVCVRDALGNVSTEAKVDINNIDTTPPNVPVINNAGNYTSSIFYNTAQTISAGFMPTSGSNETLQYSLNSGTWTNGSSVNVSTEGVNTIKFRVIDETGRISGEASCVVQIDKTSPIISSVSGNPNSWTSSSVTLTVNATDALSGLDSNAYSFDGGNTWQADNKKTFDTNTNGIVIKVRDKEGNVATYDAIDITKIDKTAPQAAVILNAPNYVDSKWYNTDQVIAAVFTATDGCAEKLQYKVNDGQWTDGAYAPVTSEGKNSVSFQVVDELGRIGAQQTVQVNLDKTAPTDITISLKGNTFKNFLNKITFGIFSKDNVDVDITADSNISGINYIEYQLVDTSKGEKFDAVNGKWLKYSSLSISPEFKGAVYARAVDNAGNVSEIVNSNGVVVDNLQPTAPVVTATVDGKLSNELWTSNHIVFIASGAKALAGIDHYEYKFGANGTWTTMPAESGALDANSGKAINDELSVAAPNAGTYYFRAVSSSGIAGAETSEVIKQKPEVILPKTGSFFDTESLEIFGLLMIISGFIFLKQRKENN